MKRVIIKSMKLQNFKGLKHFEAKFAPEGGYVVGANATGKSTIVDAFQWCLFGKNAAGEAAFGIKTLGVDGKPIHKLEHSVELVLDVNGVEHVFTRTYKEKWVTKRGEKTPEMAGHTTDYLVNGAPMQQGMYEASVRAAIGESEDVFKLLTSVTQFSRLPWQSQRELLTKMAGDITLADVAAKRSDFTALLSQLGGKDLAAFRAEISAKKKRIKEEFEAIPSRVDEVERSMPAAQDWAALEKEVAECDKALASIDKNIADANAAIKSLVDAEAAKQAKISALKAQQQQALHNTQTAQRNAEYEAGAARRELQEKVADKKRDIKRANDDREDANRRAQASIEQATSSVATLNIQLQKARDDFKAAREEQFTQDFSLVCPFRKLPCGDAATIAWQRDNAAQAQANFEADKTDKLQKLSAQGHALKDKVSAENERLEKLRSDAEDINAAALEKLAALDAELEELNAQLAAMPEPEKRTLALSDVKECVDLQAKIDEDTAALKPVAAPDTTALIQSKKEFAAKRDEAKGKMAARAQIEQGERRKAELLARESELAQQRAELEKLEFTADALVHEQMDEVERRVNSLFKQVRFEMFEPQINGGERPCCNMRSTLDGSLYSDMNNAQKVQAGIDCINAVSKFYGLSAPLFIDNRESVTELPDTEAQVISLVVDAHEKVLTIKNL